MFNFQGVGEHEATLVRKFTFLSRNTAGTSLDVTLSYVPPETLNDEQEKEKRRIIGRRAFSPVEDLDQENRDLMRYYNQIIADRVMKIEGMTLRKLSELLSLNVTKLRAQGASPDDGIDMDPTDATPITDEQRKKYSIPTAITTNGQQAKANILYLVQGSAEFRNFVLTVIQDVAYYQDKAWWGEEQTKNSGSGADTSSAPRSETSPATAPSA